MEAFLTDGLRSVLDTIQAEETTEATAGLARTSTASSNLMGHSMKTLVQAWAWDAGRPEFTWMEVVTEGEEYAMDPRRGLSKGHRWPERPAPSPARWWNSCSMVVFLPAFTRPNPSVKDSWSVASPPTQNIASPCARFDGWRAPLRIRCPPCAGPWPRWVWRGVVHGAMLLTPLEVTVVGHASPHIEAFVTGWRRERMGPSIRLRHLQSDG